MQEPSQGMKESTNNQKMQKNGTTDRVSDLSDLGLAESDAQTDKADL